MHLDLFTEIMKWLNFSLLAGLIGKFLVPPLMKWLDAESDATQHAAAEASVKETEMRGRVEAARKKLDQVGKEIEEMQRDALHHAKVMLHTLKTETDEDLARLRQFAEYEVKRIEMETKENIKIQVIEQAVALSQTTLSSALTEKDQRVLNQKFFKWVGSPS